ncbi:Serine threonine- kinase bur1 [Lecanosticta acicola]|uniref:Serine/threonine-protein kinase BUR1 n=1 Tax=Lecanosticta acicola TaxID=111012 RepID=A0AAI8Z635_9PEZI|nr:Serine threonine- kinase bur1 [Lecanosticta acicola]
MSRALTPPAVAEGMTDPTQRRFRGSAKISEYEIMKEKLGEGTFGVVSKAKSKRTGAIVALKKILMHNEKEGFPITALREVKLLKMLSHPNILRLEEMAVERQQVDDKGKSGKKRATLYMVTPYMDHDLSGMLTNPDIRFTDAQVKCYMLQLLEGLRYLHDSHILHRDMKAANILISNRGILQIADFGLARNYDGIVPQPGKGNGEAVRDYTSLVVTRWYRPPELLLTLKRYTPAIDMWGVGCVFGEMFENKPILEGRSDVEQCVRIFNLLGNPTEQNMPGWSSLPGCEGHKDWERSSGDIDQRFGKRMGPEGLDLLKRLLCLDWRRRINAIDALQHPYFKTYPLPAKPEALPQYNDSHELDARRRGNHEKQRALPPAPAGGTVGMGPDEWAPGPGPNGYQNGYGYGDRRGYGRDRGVPSPGHGPPRGYDDRRGPPAPPVTGREPAWRQADRRPPPPSNGHALPPRPTGDLPLSRAERADRVDAPARGPPPPPAANRSNVDTYIPSYQRGPSYEDRDGRPPPPPRDSYERGRRSSHDDPYYDSAPRRFREPDAPPPRQYHDTDAPAGRPSTRESNRDRPDYRRDDQRRTRSRSPERTRRERLQDRERDLYRR